jgi:FkbM family methyltransferase
MKHFVNSVLSRLGYRISRIPFDEGMDALKIQKILLGSLGDKLTIFDVGAYKGETALMYKRLFPDSNIYCFEPFPESYKILQNNVTDFKNIFSYNKGLSYSRGKSKFHWNTSASTNSILPADKISSEIWGKSAPDTQKVIEIEVDTIDNFIAENALDFIDILKLDVQGSEYMVLDGAKNTIHNGKVRLIYMEIILMPTYLGQKYLDEYLLKLRLLGFRLFNFYNFSYT